MSLVAENFTAPLDSGQGLFLDNCFSDIPSVVLLLNVWKLSQNRFTSQGLSLDNFFFDIPSFVLPLNGKKLSRNCLYKKFSNSRDNSSRKKMFVLQFIIKLRKNCLDNHCLWKEFWIPKLRTNMLCAIFSLAKMGLIW